MQVSFIVERLRKVFRQAVSSGEEITEPSYETVTHFETEAVQRDCSVFN